MASTKPRRERSAATITPHKVIERLSFAKTSATRASVAIATIATAGRLTFATAWRRWLIWFRVLAYTSAFDTTGTARGEGGPSGRGSLVAMVHAADVRERDHVAFFWSLHGAWRRRVFRQ